MSIVIKYLRRGLFRLKVKTKALRVSLYSLQYARKGKINFDFWWRSCLMSCDSGFNVDNRINLIAKFMSNKIGLRLDTQTIVQFMFPLSM